MDLDEIARAYVRLALALATHDEGYVDLYFGPPELRYGSNQHVGDLESIQAQAQRLLEQLSDLQTGLADLPSENNRAHWLAGQLRALIGRIDIVQGATQPFDEETCTLYGLIAPKYDDKVFAEVLDRVDRLLPGRGRLHERYRSFRERFRVQPQYLATTMDAALSFARKKTLAECGVEPNEQLSVEYVTSRPWSGYLWYRGGYASTLQLNTDAPLRVSDILELACHEAYPGHHVQFCLADQILFRERGWVEFTVSTLFTPRRLFYDGCATYGVHLVLPGDERQQFEREVLFPCAGLDPTSAFEFHAVRAVTQPLWETSVEAGRRFLDGLMDEGTCLTWLQRYGLLSQEGAEMHIAFYKRYRTAYVQYVLGKEIVRRAVEERGESPDSPKERWERFRSLMLSPGLPR